MEAPTTRPRDVALSASALPALRHALRREAGPLATVHALQAAGFQAGRAAFDSFRSAVGGDPDSLDEESFWRRLSDFMGGRGWGTLRHDGAHPGVGTLTSSDWAEAEEGSGESQPSCAFTSGMLSGFLTRAAGGPVAVLQVACRSRGDDACVFAFGSEGAIRELYGLLLEGTDFPSALAAL